MICESSKPWSSNLRCCPKMSALQRVTYFCQTWVQSYKVFNNFSNEKIGASLLKCLPYSNCFIWSSVPQRPVRGPILVRINSLNGPFVIQCGYKTCLKWSTIWYCGPQGKNLLYMVRESNKFGNYWCGGTFRSLKLLYCTVLFCKNLGVRHWNS